MIVGELKAQGSRRRCCALARSLSSLVRANSEPDSPNKMVSALLTCVATECKVQRNKNRNLKHPLESFTIKSPIAEKQTERQRASKIVQRNCAKNIPPHVATNTKTKQNKNKPACTLDMLTSAWGLPVQSNLPPVPQNQKYKYNRKYKYKYN